MEKTYTVEGLAVGGGDTVELTLSAKWNYKSATGRHRVHVPVSQEFSEGLHIGAEVILTISKKEE